MARSLPPSLVKGIRDIATLPSATFDEFLARLRAIPVEIKQHRVFSGTDFDISGPSDKGQSLKEAAFSLLLSRAGNRVPADQFINELIETLSSPPTIEPDLVPSLRERLVAILNIASLDLVARAHDVLVEHSQTFSSARIVSDIRPVFGNDVNAEPLGAVLVHMLSLVYYSTGQRHNFVLAMDEKDIDELIDVLQRARTKAATLKRTTIEQGHLSYIKVV